MVNVVSKPSVLFAYSAAWEKAARAHALARTRARAHTHACAHAHSRTHTVLCTKKNPEGMLLMLLHRPVLLHTRVCMNFEILYLGKPQAPEFVPPPQKKRHFTKIKTVAGCF